ncbi:MAG: indole-3-glycerol phosphate synthase TrpC [Bacteroidota bacterium]
MDILERIVAYKHIEVGGQKQLVSSRSLERSQYFDKPTVSLKKALLDSKKSGIVAEFKRHSPSKKDINVTAKVEDVTVGYTKAKVSGISILTDTKFFKGRKEDVLIARRYNPNTPILRKEFIVDEYQLLEAKAIGADVILLIAECLEKERLAALAKFAKSLGLEVLTEIHSAEQLPKLTEDIDIVGVNNRNLKTFQVDLQHSKDLFHKIPSHFVRISESGISHPDTILDLKAHGFQGFLIGENFMKTDNPAVACKDFTEAIRSGLVQM